MRTDVTRLSTRMALAFALCCLVLASCKTTEENYRKSYVAAVEKIKAKEADSDSTDTTIHNKVLDASRPHEIEVGEQKVMYMQGNIWQPDKTAGEKMRRYNVVVGAMRQKFNANAFCTRLTENGNDAYVLQDSQKNYFVVAAGFDTLEEAARYLQEIDKNVKVKIPVATPFVYRTLRL